MQEPKHGGSLPFIFPSSLSLQEGHWQRYNHTISPGSSSSSGGLTLIIGLEQTYPGELLGCRCAPVFILATRLFRFVCSLTRNPAILTDGCWCSARTPFISDPCLQSSRPVVQWDPSCSINATEVFPSLVSSTRGARLCLYGRWAWSLTSRPANWRSGHSLKDKTDRRVYRPMRERTSRAAYYYLGLHNSLISGSPPSP